MFWQGLCVFLFDQKRDQIFDDLYTNRLPVIIPQIPDSEKILWSCHDDSWQQVPVWAHHRWGKKLFADKIRPNSHKLSATFQWGDNYNNLNCLIKLPEENHFIWGFSRPVIQRKKMVDKLQWNFSEFLCISGSQVLLHYSQWIEMLVRYNQQLGHQQTDYTLHSVLWNCFSRNQTCQLQIRHWSEIWKWGNIFKLLFNDYDNIYWADGKYAIFSSLFLTLKPDFGWGNCLSLTLNECDSCHVKMQSLESICECKGVFNCF